MKKFIVLGLCVLIATSGLACDERPTVREGNGASLYPPVSHDGRYVAFYSLATNLVSDDTNNEGDVFIHDREIGTTQRVSVGSNGEQGNGDSTWPSISGNGQYVAFTSNADNLVPNDTNVLKDVFVYDTKNKRVKRVNVSSRGVEANGDSYTYFPSISSDGRFVAFSSDASNLVPDDTNEAWDVFVHDLDSKSTIRVSVDSRGQEAQGPSLHAVISGDGRYVAFHSHAGNLVSDDTNEVEDVFVHDIVAGDTTRVSVGSDNKEGNDSSTRAAISFDGRLVAFSSDANNLVSEDTNDSQDVFV